VTIPWPKAPPLPPPPRRHRDVGWWVAAVLIGLTGVTVAALVTIFAVGLWVYATHDRIELIDRPEVMEVVDAGCTRLRADLAANPVDRALQAPQRAAAIAAQDRAIRTFVDGVRGALDPRVRADDVPVDEWLDDWTRLVDAREKVAEALARGATARMVVPRGGGLPITERMGSVGLDCADLTALVRLP
jgi:hypothetical protein